MSIKSIASSILLSSCIFITAYAAIDPNTYIGQSFTDTAFSNPATDSTWVFEDCTFENPLNGPGSGWGTSAGAYLVQFKGTSANFASFILDGGQANSSKTFELIGTVGARSALIGSDANWNFNVTTSTAAASGVSNVLRLSGYSDLSMKHLKIASDPGFLSGTAGIDIVGAGNTLLVSDNAWINTDVAAADSNNNLFLNLSGTKEAKSTATFKKELNIRSAGTGNTSVNIKGNADFTVNGPFRHGATSKIGKADFIVSGENNTLDFTAGANSFLVGGDMTGGEVSFVFGGKNNSLNVAGTAYVGSAITGTGKVIFSVEGSGHNINFNSGFNLRAKNGNQALIKFVADADGFSTLNVKSLGMLDGDFLIDLTNFVGDGDGIYAISLISASNNWSALADSLVGTSESGESRANVIMGDNGESWEIRYNNGSLMFYYSYINIPEPSTYAAILGALVLALAMYRRRK